MCLGPSLRKPIETGNEVKEKRRNELKDGLRKRGEMLTVAGRSGAKPKAKDKNPAKPKPKNDLINLINDGCQAMEIATNIDAQNPNVIDLLDDDEEMENVADGATAAAAIEID